MRKLLAVVVLVLSGCCAEPNKLEVQQERALTDVVKPRDLKYTQADPNLTDAQKKDVEDFWSAWESYLQDREKRAGSK